MTVPPGLITESTPTFLRFKVPLGAVTAKIAITTVDGTALSGPTLPVQQPPRATKFAPATAPVGTTLTITGTNLGTVTEVKFSGAAPVAPTPLTPTSLQVVIPPDALTGPVSLTNSVGTGASTGIFKIAPKITDFAPPAGVVGGSDDPVHVTGTNLRAAAGTPIVKVGAMTVPPGLITESTPNVPAVQGPARRRHREDRHHDRRWHRPQRADPPRAAATPGDQVCARHRAGRHDPHDHRDQPGHGARR